MAFKKIKTPTFTPAYFSTSKPRFLMQKLLLSISVFLTVPISVVGCQDSKQAPKVQIKQNEVIVDKSMIKTNNPERYQPTYNLEGALIPVDIIEISSPYEGNHLQYLVNQGDTVKKDQVIARMYSTMRAKDIDAANFDYLDIKIEDNTSAHAKALSPSSSTDKENSKPQKTSNNKKDANNSDKNKLSAKDLNNSQETAETTKDKADSPSISEQIKRITDLDGNEASFETTINDEALIPVTLNFKSPINGEITHIENIAKNNNDFVAENIPENQPFIRISNTHDLQLVGKLPLSAESQLSIGQTAKFTVHDVHREFTGQISHITPYPEDDYLIVRAPVLPNSEQKSLLEPGMRATMTIEYGQIELGVRMPRSAIFEADLSTLNNKHTRPKSPIEGFVWVILQDQTLDYTPVKIVKYFPESDQFLVNGVNNDSLVCLANLPKDSDGKKISID